MAFLEKITKFSKEETVRSEGCDDCETLLDHINPDIPRSGFATKSFNKYLLIITTVLVLLEGFLLLEAQKLSKTHNGTPNGLSYERTVVRKLYEHSKFSSHDEEQASEAWNSILPGHGVIALDAEYVAKTNLPPSVSMPNNSGNFLYAIEAYHAIHCLKTIRAHYVALEQDRAWNWTQGHDRHCFNALRQYIMCNVDDTILWTSGHRESGTGQTKKCNDWDALRDWAEERSARYFDVEPGMGIKHLGNYHEGDGLTW